MAVLGTMLCLTGTEARANHGGGGQATPTPVSEVASGQRTGKQKLMAYPNPARRGEWIQFAYSGGSGAAPVVELLRSDLSIMGEVQLSSSGPPGGAVTVWTGAVEAGFFAPGVYAARVRDGSGKSAYASLGGTRWLRFIVTD